MADTNKSRACLEQQTRYNPEHDPINSFTSTSAACPPSNNCQDPICSIIVGLVLELVLVLVLFLVLVTILVLETQAVVSLGGHFALHLAERSSAGVGHQVGTSPKKCRPLVQQVHKCWHRTGCQCTRNSTDPWSLVAGQVYLKEEHHQAVGWVLEPAEAECR